MPAYQWSCFACGSSNPPQNALCDACQCPASCNSKAIAEYRRNFVAAGGKVGPAAAPIGDGVDFSPLGSFFKMLAFLPLLLITGWWPAGAATKSTLDEDKASRR